MNIYIYVLNMCFVWPNQNCTYELSQEGRIFKPRVSPQKGVQPQLDTPLRKKCHLNACQDKRRRAERAIFMPGDSSNAAKSGPTSWEVYKRMEFGALHLGQYMVQLYDVSSQFAFIACTSFLHVQPSTTCLFGWCVWTFNQKSTWLQAFFARPVCQQLLLIAHGDSRRCNFHLNFWEKSV